MASNALGNQATLAANKTARAAKRRPNGCNDYPERRDGDEDCARVLPYPQG